MAYIENIVIKKPLCSPEEMFASSKEDWERVEKEKTYFTEEISLPKILVEIGAVKSISEIRRNKPQLLMTLDHYDFLEVKWGKRKFYILVGE